MRNNSCCTFCHFVLLYNIFSLREEISWIVWRSSHAFFYSHGKIRWKEKIRARRKIGWWIYDRWMLVLRGHASRHSANANPRCIDLIEFTDHMGSIQGRLAFAWGQRRSFPFQFLLFYFSFIRELRFYEACNCWHLSASIEWNKLLDLSSHLSMIIQWFLFL